MGEGGRIAPGRRIYQRRRGEIAGSVGLDAKREEKRDGGLRVPITAARICPNRPCVYWLQSRLRVREP
jgi:hypothetical protein